MAVGSWMLVAFPVGTWRTAIWNGLFRIRGALERRPRMLLVLLPGLTAAGVTWSRELRPFVVSLSVWMVGLLWVSLVLPRLRPAAGEYLLLASSAVSFFTSEAVLHARPGLVPPAVRLELPGQGLRRDLVVFDGPPFEFGYRLRPNLDLAVRLDPDNPSNWGREGERLVGRVRRSAAIPLRIRTDRHGYFNANETWHAPGPILVVGDSFLGPTARVNWVSELAATLASPVLNLSAPGWGPQSELAALRIDGLARRPRAVVLVYFEGNDLFDAAVFDERRSTGRRWDEAEGVARGRPWVLPRLFSYAVWRGRLALGCAEPPVYPLEVRSGSRDLLLAFHGPSLGLLSASSADIARSANFRLVADTLRTTRHLATSSGGFFGLVGVPSKEHIYAALALRTAAGRRAVRTTSRARLGADGLLRFDGRPVDPDELLAHADDQLDLLAAFARDEQIPFLDLRQPFGQAALDGRELFHLVDTHWNDAGQALTAREVAAFLTAAGLGKRDRPATPAPR